MRIAVNTRLLRKGKMDGIGWFAYHTLKHMVGKNPGIEFHFFFDSKGYEDFIFGQNVIPHILFPPAKHALLNTIWAEWSVRRKLKKISPNIYFSPDGILCNGWNGKQHGVIHDINFVHLPGYLKFSNRKYYNYFFPKYAKKAVRLATVSEYSKKDIIETFGVAAEKIDVVYCGINSHFHPVDEDTKIITRNKYSNGHPYFIFVGTLSPRKNIKGMMKAFNLFKTQALSNIKLVIAGWGMYKTNELYNLQGELKYGSDIIFTGRLQDEEINTIVASALAMVFVPFFEGFGIPPIEAMQCDVPVIASNVTSVPEVTGDAALLVSPDDITAIANAMNLIYSDESARQMLIQKGRSRKLFFNWEKTANLLWDSIQKSK